MNTKIISSNICQLVSGSPKLYVSESRADTAAWWSARHCTRVRRRVRMYFNPNHLHTQPVEVAVTIVFIGVIISQKYLRNVVPKLVQEFDIKFSKKF